MRLLLHDYAGHPFPIQLSRVLAQRGHTVLHAYCSSLQTTPQGILTAQEEDAGRLEIKALALKAPLEKYDFFKRWRQEREYGRLIAREVARFRPDIILSGNTPLDAQWALWKAARKAGVPFAFWVQDLIGIATHRFFRKKIPLLGAVVGRYYLELEKRMLRQSDRVVLITEDFLPIMQDYGIDQGRTHVVENWAPLAEVPLCPKENAWSQAQGLTGKTCFLYAGTMGMKHNPDLLLQLALQFRPQENVRVVVVSQGLGAEWLKKQKEVHALNNLILLGFQPFEVMPQVLATAEVLVAVLEPEAGVFSVPSKVLTYLCAARPVLLAVPPENLAARIVQRVGAGLTVAPDDTKALAEAAQKLLDDPVASSQMGQKARAYAEKTFDIDRIARDFEAILSGKL